MSAKKPDVGTRAVNALATGKKPPEHPEDPQVGLGEALLWGVVLGVGVSTARLLATRATTGRNAVDVPVVVNDQD
jgi:hypothetical protein